MARLKDELLAGLEGSVAGVPVQGPVGSLGTDVNKQPKNPRDDAMSREDR